VEQAIGVIGEDVLLCACLLWQTPRRLPAQTLHQQATGLLDELARSERARQLPLRSVEDAIFAIAALIDEIAMGLADLRPYWSQVSLQATRFNTTSAGVEFFERLHTVRQGPRCVLATYAVVLGLGFQGCYGLPGADRYALAQLRRDLAVELGVDPDRDWKGGVLGRVREEQVANLELFKPPWFRANWFGRVLAALFLVAAITTLLMLWLG